MKSKREIREEIRLKIREESSGKRLRRCRKIHRALYRLEAFRTARVLFIYLSLTDEVDTIRVIKRCFATGKQVVVPRVLGRSIELRQIRNLDRDLEPGSFGVLEPRPKETRRVDPKHIDCAVIPGVAFGPGGERLGRGRGYFDRFLKRLPRRIPRIALCYLSQLSDSIPVENHDQRVDIVLSS